jgi:hypothetical protein
MDSQSDEEFEAYIARASFFGATAHTLNEYLDLVFRRAPAFAHGDSQQLIAFLADCDRWGLDFVRYARRVVAEVLGVGRAGSLVVWDESMRPVVSVWRAEQIVDWEVGRIGDRVCLVRVVLADGDERQVFRLVDGVCLREMLQRTEDGAWNVGERGEVKRDGVGLAFIPFVFHGPSHSRPNLEKLPLADIIAANLDHYRLDADYKHGLHFTVLPTAWVAGFANGADLKLGARAAWVSDLADASAGFLEFKGSGLGHLERAMDRVERRMSLLGARMLEGNKADGEGSGGNGDLCGLGAIVASLNQSLSRVLQLAQWWINGGDLDALAGKVFFAMNTDLGARALSGDEINAVVSAWRAGAISRDTMLERLKRGEVLPDGRSVAQERALIHGKAVAA